MLSIRYVSALDGGGYGQSAIGYVHAFVNAGIDVHWMPFAWPDRRVPGLRLLPPAEAEARAAALTAGSPDAVGNDLLALLRTTRAERRYELTVLHAVPESLAQFMRPDEQTIAYIAWETTRLPVHWVSTLNGLDGLVVPCMQNAEAVRESGVRTPVNVLPHVRRNFWHEFAVAELNEARKTLGIVDDRFTFYSIGTAIPRKNLNFLIESFCRAFDANDPVQLVLKTSALYEPQSAFQATVPSIKAFDEQLNALRVQLRRELPPVIVVADNDLSARFIDALHTLGDCYVSFSHGEGWGLGAFDAATFGNPVLMPAWGGHRDYLPSGWLGAVACELVPVPIWPANRPSYWPDQRWARVEMRAAIAALRYAVTEREGMRRNAREIQATIANDFDERSIADRARAILGFQR